MGMVRRINEAGTTVILVEQSLNRALSLAAAVLLHGARRDPLRRPDGGAHGPRRPPAPGLPRHRGRRPGLGAVARRLGTRLRSRPGRLLRPGLRAAGARSGARLPHQPGAQLRPGPDRRHRRRVPGQAHGRLQVQLLVRPGALRRPGRRRRRPVRAGAAPPLHPSARAGDGGHHRAQLRAARAHRAALHPAHRTSTSRCPVPFDLSFSLGPFIITPDRGAHPDRGPHRDRWPWSWRSASPRGGWPCAPCRRTPTRPACRGCGSAAPRP